MDEVRERTLEVLDEAELATPTTRCSRDGFVYEMLLAHEHQHNETMLQLLQMVERLRAGRAIDRTAAARARRGRARRWSGSKAATHEIGAGRRGFAYDNERPRHEVELGAVLDRPHPGDQRRLRRVLDETGAEPPMYWERDGEGGWVRTRDGQDRGAVDPALPVIHVSWHEADAFARWAGQAAAHGARSGRRRPPAPTASAPTSTSSPSAARRPAPTPTLPSDCGAVQMLGDVWEWTSSDFTRLPGLRGVPLPRVLGGLLRRQPTRSCAAAPGRRAAT